MEASRKRETTPSALSQLARAWSDLEERKRILRMKPKPKDVDVSPEAIRKRGALSNNGHGHKSAIAEEPDAGKPPHPSPHPSPRPKTRSAPHPEPHPEPSPLDLPDVTHDDDPSAD